MNNATPWADGINAAATARNVATSRHNAAVSRAIGGLHKADAGRLASVVMSNRVALQSGLTDTVEDASGVFARLVAVFAPQGLAAKGLDRHNQVAMVYQTLKARSLT